MTYRKAAVKSDNCKMVPGPSAVVGGLCPARSFGSVRSPEMEPTPSQIGPGSADEFFNDFFRHELPASSAPAAYETTSSPDVVRRHKRRVAAHEKRFKRASAKTAKRLFRDGLVARLWHAAAVVGP